MAQAKSVIGMLEGNLLNITYDHTTFQSQNYASLNYTSELCFPLFWVA